MPAVAWLSYERNACGSLGAPNTHAAGGTLEPAVVPYCGHYIPLPYQGIEVILCSLYGGMFYPKRLCEDLPSFPKTAFPEAFPPRGSPNGPTPSCAACPSCTARGARVHSPGEASPQGALLR